MTIWTRGPRMEDDTGDSRARSSGTTCPTSPSGLTRGRGQALLRSCGRCAGAEPCRGDGRAPRSACAASCSTTPTPPPSRSSVSRSSSRDSRSSIERRSRSMSQGVRWWRRFWASGSSPSRWMARGPAEAALPGVGDLRLDAEGHLEGVTVRAVVRASIAAGPAPRRGRTRSSWLRVDCRASPHPWSSSPRRYTTGRCGWFTCHNDRDAAVFPAQPVGTCRFAVNHRLCRVERHGP